MRSDLFTVLGTVREVEGRKRFVPASPDHMASKVATLPPGKQIACTFSVAKSTKTQSQTGYYFEIVGYLAEYTGHTKEEMHDALCRLKFGTKRVVVGGKETTVRRSIAGAGVSKAEMSELIEYALETCVLHKIRVPTAEELGYVTANPTRK